MKIYLFCHVQKHNPRAYSGVDVCVGLDVVHGVSLTGLITFRFEILEFCALVLSYTA